MSPKKKMVCPECKGSKVVPGTCVCNMEWRGNEGPNGMVDDCRCEKDPVCPRCGGSGSVEAG